MTAAVAWVFDMRSPAFGAPRDVLYREAMKMARFADEIGVDRLIISEHHGSDDGYCSAPFVLGAAFAAHTQRIRIMLGAVVLPLHDPVKIAEQIAMLDIVSGGRLEVAFGAGYIPSEFARFKAPFSERGRLMDEGLDIIVRALRGEKFVSDGREVFVQPPPLHGPQLYLAGSKKVTIDRAIEFGCGLFPTDPDLCDYYDQRCAEKGVSPGPKLVLGPPQCVFVSNDPDKMWAQILPYAMHSATSYARWSAESANSGSLYDGLIDPVQLRSSGIYKVVTPDECVALARQLSVRNQSLSFCPLLGGLPPEIGWESLTLFANAVLPKIHSLSDRAGPENQS